MNTAVNQFTTNSWSTPLCLVIMQDAQRTEILALKGTPLYAPGERSVNCAVYARRSRSLVRFHEEILQKCPELTVFSAGQLRGADIAGRGIPIITLSVTNSTR